MSKESTKFEGTTRTCPICFRTCQIIKGGLYPKHKIKETGEECPVSHRPVEHNGVIM